MFVPLSKKDRFYGIPNKNLATPQSQIPHIYFKIRKYKFLGSLLVVLIWKYCSILFSSRVLNIVIYLYVSVLQLCKVFWKYKDPVFEISNHLEVNQNNKQTSWKFIFPLCNINVGFLIEVWLILHKECRTIRFYFHKKFIFWVINVLI